MSDKRRQFLKLLGQGVVGSRGLPGLGIGGIRKNGRVERRKDGSVKVVPLLEPLAVRAISPRFLSEQERVLIADLASRGQGPTAIGRALNRSPSTISRELRRNLHPSGQYRPASHTS